MLSELVVCACDVPPAKGGATSADAWIGFFDVHTYSQTATIKKTSSVINCLAVSPSHVFAAQSDKATLGVYNRTKNTLETSIPLPEQLTAIACSRQGGLVATGTATGRLNLWETASGRYTSTGLAHLQKVTVITFDFIGNLILTGSADTKVLVWSVPGLADPRSDKQPVRTLDHHRAEITGIVCAKGSGPASVAITASRDLSCIVWNPYDGTHIRTFVFPRSPISIAIDPADRAFYAGFEDGTIKLVEFSQSSREHNVQEDHQMPTLNGAAPSSIKTYENPLFKNENRMMPTAVSDERWFSEGHSSPILSMGVVFEGNYLITGDAEGSVSIWDVATGHLFKELTKFKAPVTSIKVLPPTGFQSQDSPLTTTQTTLVPPRYHDVVKATSQEDVDSSLPPLTLGFAGELPASNFVPHSSTTTENPFSIAADFEAMHRGLKEISSPQTAVGAAPPVMQAQSSVEDAARIQTLEAELADMHDKYQRLSALQKKTWEEHAKWVIAVDSRKGEGSGEGVAE